MHECLKLDPEGTKEKKMILKDANPAIVFAACLPDGDEVVHLNLNHSRTWQQTHPHTKQADSMYRKYMLHEAIHW